MATKASKAKPIKVQPTTAAPVSSIRFIIDRSSSMSTIAKEVISGFNSFIAEQRKLPDPAVVTFTQFDDQYEVVYANKPLAEVSDLTNETYQPRGWTALNDAIGTTLSAIPTTAVGETVVIMTDGEENKSNKYTAAQVKSMVTEFQARGNQVVFIGANIDAFAVGGNYGISANNTSNFVANVKGASASFSAVSSKLSTSRSAYSAGVSDWATSGASMADLYATEMLKPDIAALNAAATLAKAKSSTTIGTPAP